MPLEYSIAWLICAVTCAGDVQWVVTAYVLASGGLVLLGGRAADVAGPLVGYCILNAGSLEEAESLARDMLIIESVRIYEAHSM